MQIKIFIFFLTFCYLANFRVATILSTDKRNVIVFVETLSIYLGFFYGEEHQM